MELRELDTDPVFILTLIYCGHEYTGLTKPLFVPQPCPTYPIWLLYRLPRRKMGITLKWTPPALEMVVSITYFLSMVSDGLC